MLMRILLVVALDHLHHVCECSASRRIIPVCGELELIFGANYLILRASHETHHPTEFERREGRARVRGGGGWDRPASLRDEAGITPADLANPRRLLDLDRVVILLNAAARELGDDALGLHVGASFGLATLGPFSYAVLNAPTVGVGLANLARYSAALGQGLGTPPLEVRGETARLEIPRIASSRRNALRHLAEAGLVMLVRMMRRLRGPDWQPRDVSFQHDAPVDTREHAALICPRLRFGCAVASIRFDARDLRAEVPGADRYLLPIAERQLQDALEPTAGSDPWLRDVEILVASRVCERQRHGRLPCAERGGSGRPEESTRS